MHYREAKIEDLDSIYKLYKEVARKTGGLARSADEITEGYVEDFVRKSIASGMIIVGDHPEVSGELVCELHAYRKGIAVFNHVLGDLTLVVHPAFQGKKMGRTIFSIFLNEIYTHRPDIGRVELIARESNTKAIALYQSLGFRIEGRMEMRIKNTDGTYEADIPMSWQNPNFEF
jgi:ribosomal protein S18 acetylase RimI-like enzyme